MKPGSASNDQPSDSAFNGQKSAKSGSDGSSNQPSKLSIAMGFTSVTCPSSLVAKAANPTVAGFRKCGLFVDDGAPLSAIGEAKLHTIEKELIFPPTIGPKPDQLATYET